jgi:hypothetical protein
LDTTVRTTILDWGARLDSLDYEAILGVSAEAGIEECRAAYHRFAQYFHPDMYPDADEPIRQTLSRIFQSGSEAYRVLTHSSLRIRWSLAKSQGHRRLTDLRPPPEVDLAKALPSLHERCRSAGAILESKMAAKAFAQGNTPGATRHLQRALAYEGGASLDLVQYLEILAADAQR